MNEMRSILPKQNNFLEVDEVEEICKDIDSENFIRRLKLILK